MSIYPAPPNRTEPSYKQFSSILYITLHDWTMQHRMNVNRNDSISTLDCQKDPDTLKKPLPILAVRSKEKHWWMTLHKKKVKRCVMNCIHAPYILVCPNKNSGLKRTCSRSVTIYLVFVVSQDSHLALTKLWPPQMQPIRSVLLCAFSPFSPATTAKSNYIGPCIAAVRVWLAVLKCMYSVSIPLRHFFQVLNPSPEFIGWNLAALAEKVLLWVLETAWRWSVFYRGIKRDSWLIKDSARDILIDQTFIHHPTGAKAWMALPAVTIVFLVAKTATKIQWKVSP